jgi:DNA-binding transcriptional LysR family regulator
VTLLSLLLPRLAIIAPDVRLRFSPMSAGIFGDLDAGRVDLGIGIITETPASIRTQIVFADRYALAMRGGHPASQARLPDTLLREARYVVVTSLAGTTNDAATYLSTYVSPMQIAMRVPSYAILPTILARTDLIALVPSTAGRAMFPDNDIAYVPPPFALPNITVATVRHERSDADPALRWLSDEVATLFQTFGR